MFLEAVDLELKPSVSSWQLERTNPRVQVIEMQLVADMMPV